MIERTRALSQGFWIKSRAPLRIAATARSTVAQAVITSTGGAPSIFCSCWTNSNPTCLARAQQSTDPVLPTASNGRLCCPLLHSPQFQAKELH